MNVGAHNLTAAHFTEAFVERLLLVLSAIPSRHAGGVQVDGLQLLMQARVGAAREAVPLAVGCAP